MDADVDPAQGDHATQSEQSDLGRGRGSLGEEHASDHRRARMAAGETRREWDAQSVGSGFLDDGPLAFESGLDQSVDDDRFGGEDCGEPPGGACVLLGAQSAHECQEDPQQAEVTEFGERIDDSIGGLGATDAIEESVDALVEAVDRIEGVGWIEFVMRQMQAGVVGGQAFDGGIEGTFGGKGIGLVDARPGGRC